MNCHSPKECGLDSRKGCFVCSDECAAEDGRADHLIRRLADPHTHPAFRDGHTPCPDCGKHIEDIPLTNGRRECAGVDNDFQTNTQEIEEPA